ncbi:MAG: ABC transporter ATP-binding protein [Ruminococcaceae bacterium]|nr:ABC transporter ATP-binding protein [Oscillospiraceae bacterium]
MIELKNITAGYNRIEVLNNINLSFEKGTITTIIGKNGCGKTTLLKTASNILKPLSGEVIIDGKDISAFQGKELAKKLSFLPQTRNVPNITAYNLVMHGRYPYLGFSRTPKEEDREIVSKAVEVLNMEEYINKNVRRLSGGQSQKVYLAMILAQNTDVVFLDEPTIYLDINHKLEILEIIKRLKEMGKTIVMVLHDLSNALSYSDKVCLLEKGEVVICDTPEKVFESKEIDRVFNVKSTRIALDAEEQNQYVFCLKR